MVKVIKSIRMRWVVHVAHMGEIIYDLKTLIRKSQCKRSLG